MLRSRTLQGALSANERLRPFAPWTLRQHPHVLRRSASNPCRGHLCSVCDLCMPIGRSGHAAFGPHIHASCMHSYLQMVYKVCALSRVKHSTFIGGILQKPVHRCTHTCIKKLLYTSNACREVAMHTNHACSSTSTTHPAPPCFARAGRSPA